jgi:ABC-type multidrug transport system fused ATPase/permease subunit
MNNSTVFIISKHLSTVLSCERVIVLRDGNIVEFDHPKVLMNNSSSEFSSIKNEIF